MKCNWKKISKFYFPSCWAAHYCRHKHLYVESLYCITHNSGLYLILSHVPASLLISDEIISCNFLLLLPFFLLQFSTMLRRFKFVSPKHILKPLVHVDVDFRFALLSKTHHIRKRCKCVSGQTIMWYNMM